MQTQTLTESLNDLGKKYGTDKADEHHAYKGMTYLDIYQRYMEHKTYGS